MKTSLFEITVLVNGKPVREYDHEGQTFIEGRKGSEFELRFRNLSGRRVLAVPAVDGLSVMDGEPASEQSRGYLVRAYDSVTIPGWRLDDASISKFVFSDRKGSYSEQSGQGTANTGVIGFMVFEEEVAAPPPTINLVWPSPSAFPNLTPWWTSQPYCSINAVSRSLGTADMPAVHPCNTAALSMNSSVLGSTGASSFAASASVTEPHRMIDPASLSLDDDAGLGTGFGDQAEHAVHRVEFRRKSATPAASLVIFYDSRRNLERKGIQIVAEHGEARTAPNPFPAMTTGCTPPPGWKKAEPRRSSMEPNDKGGIDLTHDDIVAILIAEVEKKFPHLARDRHPDIRFVITDAGLDAEVYFSSYN